MSIETDLAAISEVSNQLPKACAEQGETAEETIILQTLVDFCHCFASASGSGGAVMLLPAIQQGFGAVYSSAFCCYANSD